MICSTLAFTHFSQTKPTSSLTIQKILEREAAKSKVVLILGIRFGIFGAGGNVGNAKSILGINDGKSGRIGGLGRTGIFGIVKLKSSILILRSRFVERSILGGDGILGMLGREIFIGTK